MSDQAGQLRWRDGVAAATAMFTMVMFAPVWWTAFVFDDANILSWCDAHPDWRVALGTLLHRPLLPALMLHARPLQQASFELQCWMTGGDLDPTFGLLNAVLHAANAWLLLVWVHEVLWLANAGRPPLRLAAATVTALWWACHPLLASSVDYVVQRANLLAVLGLLVCLATAATALRSGWTWWRVLTVLLGLWGAARSKEWGVAALPATALVLVMFRPARWRLWAVLGVAGAAVATWAAWPALQWRLQASAARGAGAVSFEDGFWSQLRVFFLQLWHLAWPRVAGMSVDHPWNPQQDGGGALEALGLLGVVALGVAAWWRGHKAAALALGLLLGAHLPFLLSPGTEFLVDYKAYLLAPGVALALAVLATQAPILVLGQLVLATALSTQLLHVHLLHSNPVALWSHAAQQPHAGPRAHHNLAVALWKAGDWPRAQSLLEQVVQHSPTYPNAWENLAELRAEQNLFGPALDAAQHALELRPRGLRARLLAVRMAAELLDVPLALTHAQRLWATPGAPGEAASWLGWLLLLDGQATRVDVVLAQLKASHPEDHLIAANLLEEDIQLDVPCRPGLPVPVLHRLALLLADLRANAGELHVAVPRFTHLLQQQPLLATELMVRLGRAEGARGREVEARRWLREALDRCPGHEGALRVQQLLKE